MLESVLQRKKASLKVGISVKTAVTVGIIALAVGLPQLVHIFAGPKGGVTWLPMYLPILLGGCILGYKWGLIAGVAAPLVSFAITSLAGSPMPAAERLPFMMAELAVFAAISGLFSKKIAENGWMAFPAVILAEVCGRGFFLLLVAIFQSVSSLSVQMVWGQINTGMFALVLQAVLVPFAVMGIRLLLKGKGKDDVE